jgi:hypothetical protein
MSVEKMGVKDMEQISNTHSFAYTNFLVINSKISLLKKLLIFG